MTRTTPCSRPHRQCAALRAALATCVRGAATIELALVLPLFLALLMGILVYGQYFLIAHAVQQAANDGARAAIVGLDGADRRAIAIRAVDRSLASIGHFTPATRSVAVSESGEAVTVAVTYTAPEDSFLRSAFVPVPSPVIRTRATFELPVD
ncbi:MAG: transporter [Sphingopyxis sp.]|uniref:TadE/TadG family type IV pilus assembly protein n=1 Tax=Sphingopyxis sp. TaxID=1908224 RepID=UPI003D80E3EB